MKVHMTKQGVYQPLPGPETSKPSYESTDQEGPSYTPFLAPPLPKFDPTLCPNYKGASIGLSQIRKMMEKERAKTCTLFGVIHMWDLRACVFFYKFPRWLSGKESTCQCRRHVFQPRVRKIPGRRIGQPSQVFWPGKSYVQRSLAGDNGP